MSYSVEREIYFKKRKSWKIYQFFESLLLKYEKVFKDYRIFSKFQPKKINIKTQRIVVIIMTIL